VGSFLHINDVLEYEQASIEAGKFFSHPGNFVMDIYGIHGSNPRVSAQVLLREFTFPMPDIIMDLKKGVLRVSYAPQKTFLVFRQEGDRLDVKEINRFGRDLLTLCDGTHSVLDICEKLYPVHGKDHSWDHFMVLCVDAIRMLGEMGILHEGSLDHPDERR